MKNGFVTEFYAASCVRDGGAVLFGLTEDGSLEQLGKVAMPSPGWCEIRNGRIAAEVTDPEAGEAYAEYSILSGRRLRGPVPSQGVSFCHFAADGDEVWCANYSTGSVLHIRGDEVSLTEHRVPEDGELGPDKGRQERPHCHQCLLSPDKRFVLVSDLGLDAVFVYDRDMNLVSKAKVPAGHGARHAAFSPDGRTLYALAEMASSLTVMDWDGARGILTPLETVSFRPVFPELTETDARLYTADNIDHDRLTDAASIAVSPDGRHVFCSNRGSANTVAHIALDEQGRKPRVVSQTPSGGNHPRAIGLLAGGRFLAVCNTFSDNLTVFRVGEDGELVLASDCAVPRPQWIGEV